MGAQAKKNYLINLKQSARLTTLNGKTCICIQYICTLVKNSRDFMNHVLMCK